MEADLEAWGASDDVKSAYDKAQEADEFEVWAENWDTVQLFLLVQTQWRTGSMGGVIGLDYTAIASAVRFAEVDVTPEIFDGLRIMESAAVTALNEETQSS